MKKIVRTTEIVWESESTLLVRRRQTVTRCGNNETDGSARPDNTDLAIDSSAAGDGKDHPHSEGENDEE